MINSVVIQVIPHDKQKYPTAGDYELIGNALKISVSEMGNWKYNMAVALHELAEALICHSRGIDFQDIDSFDIAFEKNRLRGDLREPGDSPEAPYHLEHGIATGMERILMSCFLENWKKYEDTCNEL